MKERTILEKDFEFVFLPEFRKRRVFVFFGIFFTSDTFEFTSKKLFGKIQILEQKYKSRHVIFSDGWSYQHGWSEWKEHFTFVEITNYEQQI